MSYGDPTAACTSGRWTRRRPQPFFRQAVELGVTFWDTANVYGGGTSEEFVGRAIKRYSRREDIVLATKVCGKMHDGPGGAGLSRKAILEQVDASLRRLGTDYIDLYHIHRFDPETPVEETMEALHDVVKAGKVRYLGASSMWAWQFAKLQHAADLHGWTRFVAMQDQYNLLKREEEREMMPMCLRPGRRLDPVLAAGQGPARPALGQQSTDALVRRGTSKPSTGTSTSRSSTPSSGSPEPRRPDGPDRAGLGAVQAGGVAPHRRATKPHHLPDAVAALDIDLTDDEISRLEEPYTPQDELLVVTFSTQALELRVWRRREMERPSWRSASSAPAWRCRRSGWAAWG